MDDLQPSPQSDASENRLESWKEIAGYLNRDVSTVKRWERHEHLPVRRHQHQLRSSVYAYRTELDGWRANRRPADETPAIVRVPNPVRQVAAFAALLLITMAATGDSMLSKAVKVSAQQRGGLVQRRVLSQQDMDLNNFFAMKPSPDGRQLAYSALGSEEGALYVRDLRSGKTRKLTTGTFTYSPVWSPDGKRIGYGATKPLTNVARPPSSAANSVLEILDLAKGTSTALVNIENTDVIPLDWSRDGGQLLCTLRRQDHTSSLALVSISTGGLTTLVSQGWTDNATASFSPDGRFVAFAATDDGIPDIYVLAVDGSRKQRITQGTGPNTFPLWSPAGDTLLYQGRDAAWVISISDGRPQGAPHVVSSKPFDQPLSWTTGGGLFYVAYNLVSRGYVVPVKEGPAQAAGAVQRLEPDLDQMDRFSWSPDMKSVAISRYADSKIYLYSRTDRSLRSFATGLERSPAASWWSGDGQAVLFSPDQGTTVFSLHPLDGTVHQLFTRIAEAERLRVSPDGTQMLFYNGKRFTGQRQLVVSKTGESAGRVIASEPDPAGGLSNWVRAAFSPDGTQVLFGRFNQTEDSLWVAGVNGSAPRKLVSLSSRPPGAQVRAGDARHLTDATWSPNQRYIVYADGRSLFVVNVNTGDREPLELSQEFRDLRVMQWSPDGSQVGFYGRTANYELWKAENLPAAMTATR